MNKEPEGNAGAEPVDRSETERKPAKDFGAESESLEQAAAEPESEEQPAAGAQSKEQPPTEPDPKRQAAAEFGLEEQPATEPKSEEQPAAEPKSEEQLAAELKSSEQSAAEPGSEEQLGVSAEPGSSLTAESPSAAVIFYRQVRDLLDVNWPTIRAVGVLLTLIGVIVAVWRIILYTEFVSEQLAEPELSGGAYYWVGKRPDLEQIKTEMIDALLESVISAMESEQIPLDYELLKEVRISREIPPAPVGVLVWLENVGSTSDNDISVAVSWTGEIAAVDANSLARWEVIDGGEGDSGAVISVDWIAEGELIVIGLIYAPTRSADDMLELSVEHPDAPALTSNRAEETRYLPTFVVVPGSSSPAYDSIEVQAGSSQTSPQRLEVTTPLPFQIPADISEAIRNFIEKHSADAN